MSDSERAQTTFAGELEPGAGFQAPSLDDWTAAAQASLGETPLAKLTKTLPEGVAVKPLYTTADAAADPGLPGMAPFTRGRTPLGAHLDGWEVCPLYDHPDPAVAASQLERETRRGASGVCIRLDQSARLGLDPDEPRWAEVAGDGVLAYSADDLDRLFEPVEVRGVPVRLDGGGATLAAAALYLAAARRHRLEPAALAGAFELDPLGALAADSELALGLDRSLALLPELAAWAKEHAPRLRTVTVSTVPYHAAGATATQELAIALATGVEYLRTLEAAGLDPDAACDRLRFVFAVGRDLFVEAAKLRAFRRLWWQVMEACGAGDAAGRVELHAVTSPRALTVRDPWVNLLRGTVEGFAAAVGGADVVTTLPFDAAIGPADELGRRIALNTQTILREESHLHHV
ncbi:MAG TPA: methylmalonyl-CoA mutase family protein, partial [Thermoanaerobaculia bacterium]|nr:methylmalonyl-CoA mutase family protein [Thermoanaerobaculia bacterium]